MVDLVMMDGMKISFLFQIYKYRFVFLFFRPGLPGINGQAGLPGLPGAKVNLID
jgi:hypothetical protein